jgi:hypothetical protein
MSRRSDWADLRRAVVAAGGSLVRSRGTLHWKVYGSDGRYVTSMPSTPGEGRGYANARATLRRAGLLPTERNRP